MKMLLAAFSCTLLMAVFAAGCSPLTCGDQLLLNGEPFTCDRCFESLGCVYDEVLDVWGCAGYGGADERCSIRSQDGDGVQSATCGANSLSCD